MWDVSSAIRERDQINSFARVTLGDDVRIIYDTLGKEREGYILVHNNMDLIVTTNNEGCWIVMI